MGLAEAEISVAAKFASYPGCCLRETAQACHEGILRLIRLRRFKILSDGDNPTLVQVEVRDDLLFISLRAKEQQM
jgi:hypothetical protein